MTGGLINVTLGLGATNSKALGGHLGDSNSEGYDLMMRDGETLRSPIAFNDLRRYADS